MKKIIIVFLLSFIAVTVNCQTERKTYWDMAVISETGDTIAMFNLNPVYVFAPMKFKDEKQRQAYSKLVRDVRITYPYARKIAEAVIETYEYMQTLPTDKERQKYLEDVQKFMTSEYKPKLKKMTKAQGKILIKLVDRECNTSSYNIVKALLGSFKAGVYNAFAGLFGNSLKVEYEPDGRDAEIENIVVQIKQGTIDYYYTRNYHGW
ncbi:DUF4294 domain-containing protein [Dysgonomonas reticulitermitis]|nr:hypothetical protein FACS1894169_13000 [Bacteroidia bacterium]